MKNRILRFIPLLIAIAMVIGILIGSFYANHFSGKRLAIVASGNNKITDLLHLLDDQYVDSVSINDLVEKTIPKLLLGKENRNEDGTWAMPVYAPEKEFNFCPMCGTQMLEELQNEKE